jgi:acyl dehydratase
MTTNAITGPWFEDFHLGLEFDAPAVTLTAGHAALHQALFGDRMRLPLDHATSTQVTAHATAICHPLLAVNIAIGQSTWASQRVKANLFYRGLVLQRPVFLGDTLYTRTRVVGLRQNRAQAGRAATGIVALEMTTTNQHDETVLHFWRCPMIPCRDAEARTGHADDLERIGAAVSLDAVRAAVPRGWSLQPTAVLARPRVPPTFHRASASPSRPAIRSLRHLSWCGLSLNMAMAHTDSKLSYLGERLVFGVTPSSWASRNSPAPCPTCSDSLPGRTAITSHRWSRVTGCAPPAA